jgi:hypothetical protein
MTQKLSKSFPSFDSTQFILFIGKVTRESNARMQWADYFCNMVNCYQVAIKGWPEHIPFTNLSSVTNVLPDLHTLLDCWKLGNIRWEVLDDKELKQLHCKHNEKIDSGDIIKSHQRTWCDNHISAGWISVLTPTFPLIITMELTD